MGGASARTPATACVRDGFVGGARPWSRARSGERQEGNGRGDTVRLSARGTLRRVRKALLGTSGRSLSPCWRRIGSWRNAANPMTGSGVRQTRSLHTEQAVEVVRDHEGGTRCRGVVPVARRDSSESRDVDVWQVGRWRGVSEQDHERRSAGCSVRRVLRGVSAPCCERSEGTPRCRGSMAAASCSGR